MQQYQEQSTAFSSRGGVAWNVGNVGEVVVRSLAAALAAARETPREDFTFATLIHEVLERSVNVLAVDAFRHFIEKPDPSFWFSVRDGAIWLDVSIGPEFYTDKWTTSVWKGMRFSERLVSILNEQRNDDYVELLHADGEGENHDEFDSVRVEHSYRVAAAAFADLARRFEAQADIDRDAREGKGC